MQFKAGDWVEIRSKEDILRTLDKKGRLEELPFMPQMFQYCGQRFQVYKRAHKTCDTVNWTGGRRLRNGVHLDTRCDGEAHGGCQAACLIFWKEAWLKPISEAVILSKPSSNIEVKPVGAVICMESDVWAGTSSEKLPGEEITYVCQATKLPDFTTLLPWWDFRQYWEDFTSGNATLGRMFCGLVYAGFFAFCQKTSGISWKMGLLLRWFYDRFQSIYGGLPFPRKEGTIPAGQPTPTGALNLQPGEMVRVKSYEEILATLDTNNKNRGMVFDAELLPYCGGTFRVRSRVSKYIDEKSGKMSALKNPSIILENVWCQSRYSDCRMFCPRSIYPWWREIWLERVPDTSGH